MVFGMMVFKRTSEGIQLAPSHLTDDDSEAQRSFAGNLAAHSCIASSSSFHSTISLSFTPRQAPWFSLRDL